MNVTSKKPASQVPVAKQAAEQKAAGTNTLGFNPDEAREALAAETARPDGVRGDAAPAAPPVRLLSKPEVLAITNVSYPTLWSWMRRGEFPRARIAGSKNFWRSDEVDAWLAGLQVRRLKGDADAA
jgi:predicted DNA-binding transcriptional regulator AlpA